MNRSFKRHPEARAFSAAKRRGNKIFVKYGVPRLAAWWMRDKPIRALMRWLFDRSQSDEGKKQVYGENLTCDTERPKLHIGPIEDEDNVDKRRAAIGLMRLELYAWLVVGMEPKVS